LPNRKLKPWQGVALALTLGSTISVFGTVIHQTRINEVPVGAVLGLTLILWGALFLRARLRKSAGWLYAGVIAVLLTIFAQPADDVMVPATDLSYTWTYGAIAIAALVAAFPRIAKEVWSKRI
jgi:peptidoglycan/LPS O-acetylase OafA/YrhL